MLIILFGLSGSGKNYVGEIFQRNFGFHFLDADTLLLPEMRQCIQEKRPFTQVMRDQFTQVMIASIQELRKQYPNLVIVQGLYKEQNRLTLAQAFPEMDWVLVEASSEMISQRVQIRGNVVDNAYVEKIRQNFEPPRLSYGSLQNNGDKESIISQITSLFPSLQK